MTTVHTFASGSSGNALLLSWEEGHLLVDAGISCRRIIQNLKSLGLEAGDLCGVFITHTHSDHISGLQTLLKRTSCPVWATAQAAGDLRGRFPGLEGRFREISFCGKVLLDGCSVTAIPTSHDAPGPCGYRFDTASGSAGILTDTGYVTPEAEALLPGVDLVVLEANHDVEMLESGPYPYFLKERILGPQGHLSNEAAGRFAAALAKTGTAGIVLAHLSRENNTPSVAREAVRRALEAAGVKPGLSVAPREEASAAYVLRAAE